MIMEEEFTNFKIKQNYYKEKYKNRQKVFFSQPRSGDVYDEKSNKTVHLKAKGRTYIKEKEVENNGK